MPPPIQGPLNPPDVFIPRDPPDPRNWSPAGLPPRPAFPSPRDPYGNVSLADDLMRGTGPWLTHSQTRDLYQTAPPLDYRENVQSRMLGRYEKYLRILKEAEAMAREHGLEENIGATNRERLLMERAGEEFPEPGVFSVPGPETIPLRKPGAPLFPLPFNPNKLPAG